MDITKRIKSIKECFNNLSKLEELYYLCCEDYAMLSDEMIYSIRSVQNKKKELKSQELKSMAEFEREFELSTEYMVIKSIKYKMKGYERLLSGVKVRIESLKAGLKGVY
jgi:hypothetical protein